MGFSLTSDELNYLVFRYLRESGFAHTSFVFEHEAAANKCTVEEGLVPNGTLVTVLQKGLQCLEIEANQIDSDSEDNDEDFMLFAPLDLITKDPAQLRQMAKENREALRKNKEAEKEQEGGGGGVTEEERREKSKGEEPKAVFRSPTSGASLIQSTDVTYLKSSSPEVYAFSWSPTESLLASGSRNSRVCIWNISGQSQTGQANVRIQRDLAIRSNNQDVITVDWNGDGTLLATGSGDGHARIWYPFGGLHSTLAKHNGPVLSLKWNKTGDSLVTGSSDGNAIVWDVKSGTCKQKFAFHDGTIHDVDWHNAESFATCSLDTMIHVFKIGEARPIQTFSGHQGAVNCIRWDPSGSLLGSCSDDSTLKIWKMKEAKCVHELREHSMEITTIRWSPTGRGSKNPSHKPLLASGSYDSTVKLWDPEAGKLLCSLDGHSRRVHSIEFSPNGEYLASGSGDKSVLIWSVKDQRVIKTYKGDAGINQVCWNKDGNKVAVCTANNKGCVLDIRI